MATDKNYDLSWVPGVIKGWHNGSWCGSCKRKTKDPIVGHDGFCPVPALFKLVERLESLASFEDVDEITEDIADSIGLRRSEYIEMAYDNIQSSAKNIYEMLVQKAKD